MACTQISLLRLHLCYVFCPLKNELVAFSFLKQSDLLFHFLLSLSSKCTSVIIEYSAAVASCWITQFMVNSFYSVYKEPTFTPWENQIFHCCCVKWNFFPQGKGVCVGGRLRKCENLFEKCRQLLQRKCKHYGTLWHYLSNANVFAFERW